MPGSPLSFRLPALVVWLSLGLRDRVPRRAGRGSLRVCPARSSGALLARQEQHNRAGGTDPQTLLCCPIPQEIRASSLRCSAESDGDCEVVERDAESVTVGCLGGDVVVAAAQILHKGVTGGEDPR